MQRLAVSVSIAFIALIARANAAPPLKEMPIDFVGEWCNGTMTDGEVNWQLPSWVGEDGKCGNILSVTRYEFRMMIGKTSYSCSPKTIGAKQDTAPSGTTYMARITAQCSTDPYGGRTTPAVFDFQRYKGNIYIKKK